MRLHNLKPLPSSRKPPKRVGRGRGSGHGKTSGRGQKGQKARTSLRTGFEGGQMPLFRRLPKLGGFKPVSRTEYQVLNVSDLERFDVGSVVDPDLLVRMRMVRKGELVKILGNGEIEKSLTVKANAFSKSAIEKIKRAGGIVEVI
ncbi:MAG: 50S ribosomal protein L15 [Actinomycetota bacterium]|nr:50S ribosomal protein L15 [Actinomycetota bacterium]